MVVCVGACAHEGGRMRARYPNGGEDCNLTIAAFAYVRVHACARICVCTCVNVCKEGGGCMNG